MSRDINKIMVKIEDEDSFKALLEASADKLLGI